MSHYTKSFAFLQLLSVEKVTLLSWVMNSVTLSGLISLVQATTGLSIMLDVNGILRTRITPGIISSENSTKPLWVSSTNSSGPASLNIAQSTMMEGTYSHMTEETYKPLFHFIIALSIISLYQSVSLVITDLLYIQNHLNLVDSKT